MSNPGWIVPDRLIFDAIKDGFAEIDAAFEAGSIDRLLERMFNSFTLADRAKVREWLRTHEVTKSIHLNFPQTIADIPCLCVVIDPTEQSGEYVGDLGARITLDNGRTALAQTSRWRSTVAVVAYAEKSDVVLWLHHIATFLLAAKRKQLFDYFRHSQRLRSRDLSFDERFAPRFVYRRIVALVAEYDQTDAVEDGPGDITSVSASAEVLSDVV